MNKSENIDALSAALVKAHAEINAVKKDASNPFFKSKYATLDSVVDAVKPPLLKAGIVVVQGVQDAEHGVAVETMLLHSSGQWISSTLRLPATKEDAQGYGSAISYGRRYGLMAICGVPAEDDDGNAATASTTTKAAISPTDGCFAALNDSQQGRAKMISKRMVELYEAKDLEGAHKLFYENELDNEMQLGIWELLKPKSKLRNELKALHESKKTQPAEATA